MSKRTRLEPEARKALILTVAVKVAMRDGLFSLSLANVSRELPGTSRATIKHYYTMEKLRTAVIYEALDRPECVALIGQAIAMGHDAVKHIKGGERRKYLNHV